MTSRRSRTMPTRYTRVAAGALLLALALQCLYLYSRLGSEQKRVMDTGSKRVIAQHMRQLGRAVYPYSVIPGGVHSAEDLAVAIERDPAVPGHYGDFGVDHV